MPKTRTYHYTVSGTGVFPFDMLRYDQAWPQYEMEMTSLIAGLGERYSSVDPNVQREIHIVSNNPPTSERWRSFGWKVIPESITAF